MSLWTAAEAAAATGGRATADWAASGVSIDTRSLCPGDLFVALKDIRDGHDFVTQALKNGAAAALVSRVPENVAKDAPLLIVDDVLAGLERLGRAGRARSGARVIGITGSVGKTSTKEMLRAVLARQGRVHAAEKSFNNHWGVPLTLARLPRDAEFAVIEIGMNHPGEIAPLARLARPHVVMITTVAAAHLEAFENLEGIAREKASICDGLKPGGHAVLNGDLATSPILIAAARAAAAHVTTFGESDAVSHRLTGLQLGRNRTVARADIDGTGLVFKLGSPGRHFALNAVGVLGVVAALDGDLALAAQDLRLWQPPAGRGTIETLTFDRFDDRLTFDLIDDAYNANPTSMAASLEVLAATAPRDDVGRIARGRRIAVLGDMLELGPDETGLHAGLAGLASLKALDLVHTVGPRMQALHDALPEDQRGIWVETAPEMVKRAHTLVDAGDVVLVKGSLGSKVSTVVDAIRKLGHPLPTQSEDQA
ncbi:MAG: UDP-N-acetylmuramoyl-tripeptide--D-alanyl-D-alanine ligase [Rhodobacter sp.]|nr:UDP-N-acetylmuramoyl-tripeptide--D-alanyl-D-alanine ligase [Rhodobacter sp.]